jgi:2-C-methyl-D-erythritol 2,4-cyclodiphosphate synthase
MMRVGIGFDVHPLIKGEELILGGVHIPYEYGLTGHSDADVLTHALMDALLGALSLGDIGRYFPDTDDRFKDISSLTLLKKVNDLILNKGYKINNIDMIIIAEAPKISPYYYKIVNNYSNVLGINNSAMNIKATTTEKLGFIGRSEGIAAQSIVLLVENKEGEKNVS